MVIIRPDEIFIKDGEKSWESSSFFYNSENKKVYDKILIMM